MRLVLVVACLVLGCNAAPRDNPHCGSGEGGDAGTCGNDGGLTMTCTPHSCGAGSFCVAGLCGHVGGRTYCTWDPFGNDDGCGASAACLENIVVDGTLDTNLTCYELGPCPPEGCPIGTMGSTCNVEGASVLYPNKDAICLVGMCRSASECPTGWHCVRDSLAHFQFCASGAPGARCASGDDCVSGVCETLAVPPGTCR